MQDAGMTMSTKIVLLVMLILALLTSSAWAGCGRWVVRENTDYLEDPLFDEAVKDSTPAGATADATLAANQSSKEDRTSGSPVQGSNVELPADLGGDWSFVLQGDPESTMDMILIQSGNRLQGYGTLLDRGSQIPATATGTVTKDALSLNVKLNRDEDCRLDMALINSTLRGSYELYENEKMAKEGNATATRD